MATISRRRAQVLGGILRYIEDRGEYPTYRAFARWWGCGLSTVHYHVKQLKAVSLIENDTRPGIRPAGSRIVVPDLQYNVR